MTIKILLLVMALPLSAFAETEEEEVARHVAALRQVEKDRLFHEYKMRRKQRYYDALAIRRKINARKVHVYRTAIAVTVRVQPVPMIQQGWIDQGPILKNRYISSLPDYYYEPSE